jgi:2-C-methyl-D-erythritol 4-phosphate cytidylyltransferase
MNTCILLAGGTGTRTGLDIPKQFVTIEGKPVFCYSAETANRCREIDAIIIVTIGTWKDFVRQWVEKLNIGKVKHIVSEGVSRQHSILNGLVKAREFMTDSDIVMIHDAARPLASERLFREAIETASAKGSALPVQQINDSVYYCEDGEFASGTMPKSALYMGQTPVCFVFGQYYQINTTSTDSELMKSSGSCTLLFNKGMRVAIFNGDPEAFKITSKEDLNKFEAHMRQNPAGNR